MSEWWEDDSWEDRRPMEFPNRQGGRMERIALTTEPEMVRGKHGQLRLILRNRHPHEALRVYR